MPSPIRQTPTPRGTPSKKGEGIFGRIAKAGSVRTGIKLLVYGKAKTGKTRLFSTFPKPSLLVGTEDGTRSIRGTGVDFVRLNNSAELDEISAGVIGKYKSVCLDTAGGLQDMILKEVLGLADAPIQKSWGLAKQQEWGIVGAQLKERLHRFLSLADRHQIDTMTIAHERTFGGGEDSHDLITPVIGAALTPSATGWLNAACDYIGQTFIAQVMKQVTTKIGVKDHVTEQPTGKIEFRLRLKENPVYTAGFRTPNPDKIPEYLVNPTYDKIVALIED